MTNASTSSSRRSFGSPENPEEAPVVFLIPALGTGGAERAVTAVTEVLRSRGRDIRILCLEHPELTESLVCSAPVDYLSNQKSNASVLIKFLLLPVLALRLRRYLRQRGSSVVMSHLFRANYVNVMAALLFRSPHRTILVNHTRPARLASEGLSGRINLILFRWLYPRADLVASVSSAAASECAELAGYGAEKTAVLYNPVDTNQAASTLQRFRVSGAFDGTVARDPGVTGVGEPTVTATPTGIANPMVKSTGSSGVTGALDGPMDSPSPFIVAVGRLIPLKRFNDLILAFARIADSYPRLRLRIVGDGPERFGLEEQVQSLALEDRVDFRGLRRDPFAEMAGATVLVSASETEGFGMTLVEALALGVPVISSDCPYGPREILAPDTDPRRLLPSPGGAVSGILLETAAYGILFPVGSVESLAEALRRLLDDGELAQGYALRGPGRAKDFDIQRVADAYEGLLFQGGSR